MNRPVPPDILTSVPLQPLPSSILPLNVENMLWANTTPAAGSAICFVIFTSSETRAVMNTSHLETKMDSMALTPLLFSFLVIPNDNYKCW
jgi:magnesium-transporting ATPase (P-type)